MNTSVEIVHAQVSGYPAPWNNRFSGRLDAFVFGANDSHVYIASPDKAMLEHLFDQYRVMHEVESQMNDEHQHVPFRVIHAASDVVYDATESVGAFSHIRYAFLVERPPAGMIEIGSNAYYEKPVKYRIHDLGAYLQCMRALHSRGYALRGNTSRDLGYLSSAGEVWMLDPSHIQKMDPDTAKQGPGYLWNLETEGNDQFWQIVHGFLGNPELEQEILNAGTLDEAINLSIMV